MIPHSRPTLGEEEAQAAAAVVQSGHVAQGRQVEAFEAEVSAYVGLQYAVAVGSGTTALGLVLRAVGVENRSVQMPSYVCSALLHAARHAGAEPLVVDVEQDGNLGARCPVSSQAAALVVPHLLGQPAPVAALCGAGVPVVEDLAMALGADGVGREGVASVCSFYATKMMTSGGEGGMVVTDDQGLAEDVRSRREYDGMDPAPVRWNAKMTDVAAAIGRVQLRRLDDFVQTRRNLAAIYRRRLAGSCFATEPDRPAGNAYRFVIDLPEGMAMEDALHHLYADGVSCQRPIDRPLHKWLGAADDAFPVASALWERSLSIPIYPTLTGAQQQEVCDALARLAHIEQQS